jgi:hypothetical protein
MKYFSGFSLTDEYTIFSDIIDIDLLKNNYTVSGFSYGAIKAFKYVLNSTKRVDKLIMFSPAFFNDKSDKFKKLQLITYKQREEYYVDNFLKNISLPYDFDFKNHFRKLGNGFIQLKELLYFKWTVENLQTIYDSGVEIEVYLGNADCIIDFNKTKEFFMPFCDIYEINNASHILHTK